MEVTRHRYAVEGWGVGELVVRDGVLVSHALPSRQRAASVQRAAPVQRTASGQRAASVAGTPPQGGATTPEVTVAADERREGDAFVAALCRRFSDHLAGRPVAYDDVAVDDDGLDGFQRELLAAARSVGWGEVVTYGGLAALAGRPRAARAAGSFCAQNRVSLVVPCHRIVAAGRGEPFALGGYGPSGTSLKRRLLALEGTVL